MSQVLQTGLPERWRQHSDQLIELAIVVHNQACEWLIGEGCRVASRLPSGNAHVVAGLLGDHAPLENRRSQDHEPPEQIESFLRIYLGHRLDYCSTLRIEIIGQRSDALPV